MLRRKYLANKILTQVSKKSGDSQFWASLMEIKDQFLSMGKFEVQNDAWVGNETLMKRFPSLYNIARKINETVVKVCSNVPLNVSFRRALTGDKLNEWLKLVAEVAEYRLNDQKDIFLWKLNKNKEFIVKSMYKEIMQHEGTPSLCASWKIKLPLKIFMFMWYLKKGVILTKDNLAKRTW